ncbi:MAG: tetratricopeptide repeat protein [Candidatus Hydrogenedentes bacterium]|nr:tetratricopeptide repeat protein [Candidatus Hydrogenedentota bacterium]
MRSEEATEKFQATKRLFAEKRYPETLAILDELDAAFPNAKNILYPKALCLAKMRRLDEAEQICRQLIAGHRDPRAARLLKRIERKGRTPQPGGQGALPQMNVAGPPVAPPADELMLAPPGAANPMAVAPPGVADPMALGSPGAADPMGLDLPDLDSPLAMGPPDLGAPLSVAPPVPAAAGGKGGSSSKMLYIAVGVVGAILVLTAVVLVMGKGGEQPGTPGEPVAEAPGESAASLAPGTPTELAWYTSYDNGMSIALQYESPTLLFFTDNSQECKDLEARLFSEPSIVQGLDGVVCIKVDFATEEDARMWHGVESAPTVIINDNFGIKLYSETAPIDPQEFYAYLTSMKLRKEPFGLGPGAIIAAALVWLLFSIWPLYLTLLLVRKLPHDEFLRDILSVGIVALGINLVAGIPCVGFILMIVVLNKTYDMEFIDFVVYFGLQILFGVLYAVIMVAVYGSAFVEFALQFTG